MKRLISIIALFIVYALNGEKCQGGNNPDKNDYYPFLNTIVASYYYTYYEFPVTINELVDFTEYCLAFNSDFYPEPDVTFFKRKIIPLLKLNANKLKIENADDFIIRLNNDTILHWDYMKPFSPCDISLFIGDEPKEYMSFIEKYLKPRFFSERQAVLLSNKVHSGFEDNIKRLQKSFINIDSIHYRSYKYEGENVPIYTFMEYRKDRGLSYFCFPPKVVPKMIFYTKLEEYLKQFGNEYSLSRVIFLIPDYFAD